MRILNTNLHGLRRWCLVGVVALLSIGAVPSISVAAGRDSSASVSIHETTDLADAFRAAEVARVAEKDARVLLILDIDNTLLTMPQYLGGDRWFNHHADLVAAKIDPDFLDMGKLIAMQVALFSFASMEATEPEIPAMLAEARRQGIDTFLLSARGPELYDATRRELDRNGLRVEGLNACATHPCMQDGTYSDDDIRSGLAAVGEEPSQSPYHDILIRNGVMLVAGQDKGVMLKLLMGAIGGRQYAHVVVADDGRKNIDALAVSGNIVPLTLFHYRRINASVTDAEDQVARAQLRTLTAVVCSALQSAICRRPMPGIEARK